MALMDTTRAAGRALFRLPLVGAPLRATWHAVRRSPAPQGADPESGFEARMLARLEQIEAAQARAADTLAERLEFVRFELMYEISHRLEAGVGGPEAQDLVREPKILEPDAVAAMAGAGYALNVGCGHKPMDGWLNVDLRPLPGVAIAATADNIPLDPGSCRAITSAHLMEHFTEEAVRRRILPHWFSLLAPGGEVSAIVPDAQAMMRAWADGAMDFDTLRLITYGAQEYDGDYHFTMYSPASLGALLEGAGFTNVSVVAQGRANGLCLEFEISAKKPG